MRTALLGIVVLLMASANVHGQRGVPIRVSVPVARPVVPHMPHIVHTGNHSGGSGDWTENIWIILGAVGGVVALVVAVLVVRSWIKAGRAVRVRVVSAPPGEAPEDIRRQWVGIDLPLSANETEPQMMETVEVLSGAPVSPALGYLVDGTKAIELLAAQSPIAADWWRENAPHITAPGYRLWFPAEACERV